MPDSVHMVRIASYSRGRLLLPLGISRVGALWTSPPVDSFPVSE